MEKAMTALADGHDKVLETRILRADQLQNLGMNLFYNVGKGAIS